jgi:hypothetical protein
VLKISENEFSIQNSNFKHLVLHGSVIKLDDINDFTQSINSNWP